MPESGLTGVVLAFAAAAVVGILWRCYASRKRRLRQADVANCAAIEWDMPDACSVVPTLQLLRRSAPIAVFAHEKRQFLSHGRMAVLRPAHNDYRCARDALVMARYKPVLARAALYSVQFEMTSVSRCVAAELCCCDRPARPAGDAAQRFELVIEQRNLSWTVPTRAASIVVWSGTGSEAAIEVGRGCAFQVHYIAPHYLAVLIDNQTAVYRVPFAANCKIATLPNGSPMSTK